MKRGRCVCADKKKRKRGQMRRRGRKEEGGVCGTELNLIFWLKGLKFSPSRPETEK